MQEFRPLSSQFESERPPFTRPAFLEALIEFIVGDDQVSLNFEIVLSLI